MAFGFETKEDFDKYVADLASNIAKGQTKGVEEKLKQFKRETAEDFTKQLSSFGEQLGAKFVSLEGALQSKRDKKTGKDGKPVDDEADAAREDPMTRTLQKKIEELEKANKKRDDELAQERAKTRAITVRQKLREGLERRGIADPFRIKAAMAVLVDQEKRVGYAESLDDAAGLDSDGAPIELDTFLDGWLQTEEGQFYAPPKGAAGSGRSPGRAPAPPNGRAGSTQTLDDLSAAFDEAIRNHTG